MARQPRPLPPPDVPPSAVPMPSPVSFIRPFGFTDDHDDAWRFDAGQIVRNPYVLSLLNGRGAPTTPFED